MNHDIITRIKPFVLEHLSLPIIQGEMGQLYELPVNSNNIKA